MGIPLRPLSEEVGSIPLRGSGSMEAREYGSSGGDTDHFFEVSQDQDFGLLARLSVFEKLIGFPRNPACSKRSVVQELTR